MYTLVYAKKWYKPCGSEAMASQSSADCCLGKTLPPRFASSALNFITGIFDNLEAFVCLSQPGEKLVFIALLFRFLTQYIFETFICLVLPGEKLCKQSWSNCGEAGSAPGQSYSPEFSQLSRTSIIQLSWTAVHQDKLILLNSVSYPELLKWLWNMYSSRHYLNP